jgi:hypothetical protein
MATLHGVELKHRHKTYHLFVRSSGALELYMDRCLRKRREASGKEPQYVWTNVELEWEEHHYIEARYWAGSGVLTVTINGDSVWSGVLPPYTQPVPWLREDAAFE